MRALQYALLVSVCCIYAPASASADPAGVCIDRLYNLAHGKSEVQLLSLSHSVFNYSFALQRAVSRNRLKMSELSAVDRQMYLKKLDDIAKTTVIPRLAKNLDQRPEVRRSFVNNGRLTIILRSGITLVVDDSCAVLDGTAAGVSLSTLAADALKTR